MLIILLLLFIVTSQSLAEDCGVTVNCPAGKTYPYFFCKYDMADPNMGSNIVRCVQDPWSDALNWKPRKIENLPICVEFYKPQCPNEEYTPPGVKVFDITEAEQDINNACRAWNCICGKENDPCQCTIILKFATNPNDITDPDDATLAEAKWNYSTYFCKVNCSSSTITINNTEDFTRRSSGSAKKFFINEDLITAEKLQEIRDKNIAIYNFMDVVMHELGHILGFDHYDDCIPPISGKMNSVQYESNGTSTGLSDYDKCMFAKLYCPTLVPVEEEPYHENSEKVKTYPNPSENIIYIKFFVSDELSKVAINIFDQFGNKLKSIIKNYKIGENIESFDLGDWESGVYYYTVQIGKSKEINKVILIK